MLTAIGTAVALQIGAIVGGPSGFDLVSADDYWLEVRTSVLDRRDGAHLLKWAPLVNTYRSMGFMASTMLIAQLCARWRRRAQPRHVPLIITSAVVLACLAVLLIDWGFSQMYVRLDDTHLAATPNASAMYTDPAASGDDALLHGADGDAERAEYEEYYATADAAAASAGSERTQMATLRATTSTRDEFDADGDHDEL